MSCSTPPYTYLEFFESRGIGWILFWLVTLRMEAESEYDLGAWYLRLLDE